MAKQHTTPCRECPWRKTSMRGWLGGDTGQPENFVAASQSEHRMPCHMTVDYEQDDWRDQAEVAPQCAGRAIHFANQCKTPRNPELLRLPANREDVFTFPAEFVAHHTLKFSK